MVGMDQFDPTDCPKGLNLFLTSTFGNGDPPTMAKEVAQWLQKADQLGSLQ